MRLTKNVGLVLLAVWLIVNALVDLRVLPGAIAGLGTILAVLALASGILILAGR